MLLCEYAFLREMRGVEKGEIGMRKISFITAVISAVAVVCAACVDPLREPESFDDGMVRLSVGPGGGE